MFRNKEEELKHLRKKLIFTNIIGSPGPILVGLGLYGKFDANGDAFISILNNQDYVHGFIVVGGIIMLWEIFTMIPLVQRKSELMNKKNA